MQEMIKTPLQMARLQQCVYMKGFPHVQSDCIGLRLRVYHNLVCETIINLN